jgi:hypothetical protein
MESSDRTRITLYIDNRAIITKISRQRMRKRTTNQHQEPDVDVEIHLMHEIKELEEKGCKIEVLYAKSPATTKIKKDITAIEQMHILADNVAKQARKRPRQKLYYSFPANPMDFILNKQHINA